MPSSIASSNGVLMYRRVPSLCLANRARSWNVYVIPPQARKRRDSEALPLWFLSAAAHCAKRASNTEFCTCSVFHDSHKQWPLFSERLLAHNFCPQWSDQHGPSFVYHFRSAFIWPLCLPAPVIRTAPRKTVHYSHIPLVLA